MITIGTRVRTTDGRTGVVTNYIAGVTDSCATHFVSFDGTNEHGRPLGGDWFEDVDLMSPEQYADMIAYLAGLPDAALSAMGVSRASVNLAVWEVLSWEVLS